VRGPLTVRLANSKAGIKPTAPLSAFDKENSIEFLSQKVTYLFCDELNIDSKSL